MSPSAVRVRRGEADAEAEGWTAAPSPHTQPVQARVKPRQVDDECAEQSVERMRMLRSAPEAALITRATALPPVGAPTCPAASGLLRCWVAPPVLSPASLRQPQLAAGWPPPLVVALVLRSQPAVSLPAVGAVHLGLSTLSLSLRPASVRVCAHQPSSLNSAAAHVTRQSLDPWLSCSTESAPRPCERQRPAGRATLRPQLSERRSRDCNCP